jgi:hypothetical protein
MRRDAQLLTCAALSACACALLPGPAAAAPGTISTFAGDPVAGGPTTGLSLGPHAIAAGPGGALYVGDYYAMAVREVSAAGDETTVAGDGAAGFAGDGAAATSAELNNPSAIVRDIAGNVLIADSTNSRIRLVATADCASNCAYGLPSTVKGDIYTVAGDEGAGFLGDGMPGTQSPLSGPDGLALDAAGNLLIADSGNQRVRVLAAADCASGCAYGLPSMVKGDLYTLAGDETQGEAGDGGPATSAELDEPSGLALDGGGDVLVADYAGQRVRLIAETDCSSGCPFGLSSMVKGDIYTVAGNGTSAYAGDGGPASAAELGYPDGIALDPAGDLVIADSTNNRIRLVAAAACASGCPYGLPSIVKGDIYTVAANGTYGYGGDGGSASGAEMREPEAVAIDSDGDLVIADTLNNVVRLVAAADCASGCPYGLSSTVKGDIYTIAGSGAVGKSGDGGPASAAGLDLPTSTALDGSAGVLIDDLRNEVVRFVADSDCASGCPYGLSSTVKGDIYTVAGDGINGYGGDGGPATAAAISYNPFFPGSIVTDPEGDLLIADTGVNRIRIVAAASCSSGCPYGLGAMTAGYIYTIAGDGGGGAGGFAGDGGAAAAAAQLSQPRGVATGPGGELAITDTLNQRIRFVAGADCSSACPFALPSTVAGDIYTIAGNGNGDFTGRGWPALDSALNLPAAVAFDPSGDAVIADSGNDRIRLVAAADCASACQYGLASMTAGDIYTLAGDGDDAYMGDGGPGPSASLDDPQGIVIDSAGNVVIADTGSDAVRLIAAADCSSACPYGLPSMVEGDIYTIAGDGIAGFAGDGGSGPAAELDGSLGVTVGAGGTVYISDSGDQRVRILTGGPTGSTEVKGAARSGAGAPAASAAAVGPDASPGHAGAPAGASRPAVTARVRLSRVRVSGAAVRATVRCAGATGCTVSLRLTRASVLAGGVRTVRLAAGVSRNVEVRLDAAARRALRRHRRLAARLIVAQRGARLLTEAISFRAASRRQ